MSIKPISLFHTPKDWDELMAWIHQHNVEDRAHLTTAAGMAWNLAFKEVCDLLLENNNEQA
jgi:hypothetical protein